MTRPKKTKTKRPGPGAPTCPSCHQLRRLGDPLCRGCYYLLPFRVRLDLTQTHRAAQAHLEDDVQWRAYAGARRVALHHLKTRP